MPFFASSSGVQINGGRFYDIAGDMNLQNTQLAATERELTMLPSGMTTESIRQSHEQHSAAAKMASDSPDPSRRPGIIGCSRHPADSHRWQPNLSFLDDRGSSPSAGKSSPSQCPLGPHPKLGLRFNPRTATPQCGNLPLHGDLYRTGPNHFALPDDTGEPPHGSYEYLQEEPKTIINDGTFISGNVNHNINIIQNDRSGFNILHQSIAGDAFHNSADRYPQPKCHPETRTEMLHDLHDWFFTDDPESRVLWLHGPAGSGKSAIAQSLCQKLEAEGNLGGSFFFKRGHPSRGHSRKLFSTIAYQLALLLPEFKHVVSKRVEEDPSLVQKSLSIQLRTLIVEPCRDSAPTRTFAVVIDGLDECEGQDIQQEILRCIGNSFYQSELPIRFIVASRPEPHIGETFCDPCLGGLHLTLNIQQSFEDVREYLVDEFARIHREHRETMATVSSPWPAQDVVAQLVEKSSGYFIYASTVIKFIDDKDFRPTDRLDVILGIAESDVGSMSPFTALDQLYIQILSDLPARSQLLRILAVIAVGLHSTLRIPKIEQLIELRPGDVRLTLRRLQSVIELPLDDEDTFLAVHHGSFLDFLGDPRRSGTFCVSGFQHRTDLACQILKTLSHVHTTLQNRNGNHVAWELGHAALKTLTSAWPSSELFSLLSSINPDFLFYKSYHEFAEDVDMILDWLTNVRPLPEDSIQLWQDYRFMHHCDYTWSHIPESAFTGTQQESQNSREILSQASPHLLKLLHAYRIAHHHDAFFDNYHSLFHIRLWVDLPWDGVRAALCSLSQIIGDDDGGLRNLLIFRPIVTLSPLKEELQSSSTSQIVDIVRSCLRILKEIEAGELPWQFRRYTWVWSRLLRSCPPCQNLLSEVKLASSSQYYDSRDCFNVLQWLETFPTSTWLAE